MPPTMLRAVLLTMVVSLAIVQPASVSGNSPTGFKMVAKGVLICCLSDGVYTRASTPQKTSSTDSGHEVKALLLATRTWRIVMRSYLF